MKSFLSWAAAMVILFGADTQAQQSATRVDVSKLGPQVGQQVPDFNLRDQNGQTQTLQTIMGPKGAMLVFIRSADW
jgi:cytochrome oxidase Cu insertion factor (SCO1/SenC/PrrC family)